MPTGYNTGLNSLEGLTSPLWDHTQRKGTLGKLMPEVKCVYRVSISGGFYLPWAKTHILGWFYTVSTFPLSLLIGSGSSGGRDGRVA